MNIIKRTFCRKTCIIYSIIAAFNIYYVAPGIFTAILLHIFLLRQLITGLHPELRTCSITKTGLHRHILNVVVAIVERWSKQTIITYNLYYLYSVSLGNIYMRFICPLF